MRNGQAVWKSQPLKYPGRPACSRLVSSKTRTRSPPPGSLSWCNDPGGRRGEFSPATSHTSASSYSRHLRTSASFLVTWGLKLTARGQQVVPDTLANSKPRNKCHETEMSLKPPSHPTPHACLQEAFFLLILFTQVALTSLTPYCLRVFAQALLFALNLFPMKYFKHNPTNQWLVWQIQGCGWEWDRGRRTTVQ